MSIAVGRAEEAENRARKKWQKEDLAEKSAGKLL